MEIYNMNLRSLKIRSYTASYSKW